MLRRAVVFPSCLAVGLMVLSGTPLFAQTHAGEVSAGWANLRWLDAADEGFSFFEKQPIGFNLGGALRATDHVGFAVDFGWNRKSQDVDPVALWARNDTRIGDWRSRFSFTTFAAGPRFYFGNRRVTVFVHALLGGSRSSTTSVIGEATGGDAHVYRRTFFLIQLGGGADIRLVEAAAVRLQLDLQGSTDGMDTGYEFLRFMIGGVFYLGER